jgi:opacity protein-like surface antigen
LLASATDTRWGWFVGVGYEYAFAGNWSAKIDDDYLGLGTKRILLDARGFDVEQDISLIKSGTNYRFGPAAVMARY